MQLIGKWEESDVTTCHVDTYFEHLEALFSVNKVRDAEKDTLLV